MWFACQITKERIQTHFRIFNTGCTSTSTMVTRRLLFVTPYTVQYPRLPTPAFQTVAVLKPEREINKILLSDSHRKRSAPTGLERSEINYVGTYTQSLTSHINTNEMQLFFSLFHLVFELYIFRTQFASIIRSITNCADPCIVIR